MLYKWMKIWYCDTVKKPSAGTVDEWIQWTASVKKNHPFIYFTFETLPRYVKTHIGRIKYFKYHVTQKYFSGYHCLKLDVDRFRQPFGEKRISKYSWIDSDLQIELFMFQILVNYIENELNYNEIRQSIADGDGMSFAEQEAFDLYEWFTNDYCDRSYEQNLYNELYKKYPEYKTYDPFSFLSSAAQSTREIDYQNDRGKVSDLVQAYDDQLNKQMTKNLIRLVNIRSSLWT